MGDVNVREAILRLSDGNACALVALCGLHVAGGDVLKVEAAGISGKQLADLFKEVCSDDLDRLNRVVDKIDPAVSKSLIETDGDWFGYVKGIADEEPKAT